MSFIAKSSHLVLSIAVKCLVSLVSLSMEYFFNLSLIFMSLTLLKAIGNLLCRRRFYLGLSNISLRFTLCKLGRNINQWWHTFFCCFDQMIHNISLSPYWWCSPSFMVLLATIKLLFYPFAINTIFTEWCF